MPFLHIVLLVGLFQHFLGNTELTKLFPVDHVCVVVVRGCLPGLLFLLFALLCGSLHVISIRAVFMPSVLVFLQLLFLLFGLLIFYSCFFVCLGDYSYVILRGVFVVNRRSLLICSP